VKYRKSRFHLFMLWMLLWDAGGSQSSPEAIGLLGLELSSNSGRREMRRLRCLREEVPGRCGGRF
ncbi:MAG: hypothetical protein PVG81_06665, partial [Desulfobacterales bacterium]